MLFISTGRSGSVGGKGECGLTSGEPVEDKDEDWEMEACEMK